MDACISSIARILSCNNVMGKMRVTFVSGNEHYLGSSENKASIFLRPYFHYCLSSVYPCKDHSNLHLLICFCGLSFGG